MEQTVVPSDAEGQGPISTFNMTLPDLINRMNERVKSFSPEGKHLCTTCNQGVATLTNVTFRAGDDEKIVIVPLVYCPVCEESRPTGCTIDTTLEELEGYRERQSRRLFSLGWFTAK